MSTKWSSYRTRWQGMEYACSPIYFDDELHLRLHSTKPQDGFEELDEGVFGRLVRADDCDMVAFITMICQWRDEPCMVHDERADELLLEYTGGKVPRALELGMERIERGVYRSWVKRDEIRGLRESTTMLVAPRF